MATKLLSLRSRTQGKDDEASRILRMVAEYKAAMRTTHEQWFHDIAFFRGNQWIYQDEATGTIQQIPAVPWRTRVTDNQTRGLIEHMVALLLERRPIYQALARNSEEEDLLAASGYEGLLTYDWDRLELTDELEDVLFWACIIGNGLWRVSWNPLAGTPVGVPVREGASFMLGKGDPPPEQEEVEEEESEFFVPGASEAREPTDFDDIVYEGDIDVVCFAPFNFGLELAALKLRRAAYCWQEAYLHRDVLVDRVGSKARNLESDLSIEEFQAYDTQLRLDSPRSIVTGNELSDYIRVVELWEAPTRKHPKGWVTTVAGGETMGRPRENPYGGRYPFVHFGAKRVPGRFWHDGVVSGVKSLQQMHNKAISRWHDIQMKASNPKWIADKNSGLKETSINDEPSEVIFKRQGTTVEAVAPPPASPIFPQVIALSANAMSTYTGVNDPLAGANPAGVRAGVTVQRLQEAAIRRFIPLSLQVELALRETGKLLLYLHKRYYDDARMGTILGSASQPEVAHLRKADIDRIVDVTITHGSMIPKSPAAQQETLFQIMQYAPVLLLDEDGEIDSEEIWGRLDMPSARGKTALKGRQRMRAFREHLEVVAGRQITAMPYDHDKLHIRIHYGRLSDDAWVEANTEAASKLLEHCAQHAVNIQAKMLGMQADPYGGPSPELLRQPGGVGSTSASGPKTPQTSGAPGPTEHPPGMGAGGGGP